MKQYKVDNIANFVCYGKTRLEMFFPYTPSLHDQKNGLV